MLYLIKYNHYFNYIIFKLVNSKLYPIQSINHSIYKQYHYYQLIYAKLFTILPMLILIYSNLNAQYNILILPL